MTHPAFLMQGTKGGVGTTVNSILLASAVRHHHGSCLLVDVTGDIGVVLGTSPDLPGIRDWVSDPNQEGWISDYFIKIAPDIDFLPKGKYPTSTIDLGTILASLPHISPLVVDAGVWRPWTNYAEHTTNDVTTVLNMNCCYQSLNRARTALVGHDFDKVWVVTDSQRSLGLLDIENAMERHADIVTTHDRSVSRWTDAGLLLDRGFNYSKPMRDFLSQLTDQLEPQEVSA